MIKGGEGYSRGREGGGEGRGTRDGTSLGSRVGEEQSVVGDERPQAVAERITAVLGWWSLVELRGL
jgi:hypothetical protein